MGALSLRTWPLGRLLTILLSNKVLVATMRAETLQVEID
jgi:hypothetical protein